MTDYKLLPPEQWALVTSGSMTKHRWNPEKGWALCGANPVGWISRYGQHTVTCKRCLRKEAKP